MLYYKTTLILNILRIEHKYGKIPKNLYSVEKCFNITLEIIKFNGIIVLVAGVIHPIG